MHAPAWLAVPGEPSVVRDTAVIFPHAAVCAHTKRRAIALPRALFIQDPDRAIEFGVPAPENSPPASRIDNVGPGVIGSSVAAELTATDCDAVRRGGAAREESEHGCEMRSGHHA
jgi:hypothetical protein